MVTAEPSPTSTQQTAIFAMGCFWCGESEFRDHDSHEPIKGISEIEVGYAGGKKPNPTYEDHEGYKEALKITFNPSIISYKELLSIFWHNVDPFDKLGQFCDKGFAYTSAIFYKSEQQKAQATSTKKAIEKQFSKTVETEILPATTFYRAEEYHQNYKAKNPRRYRFYRWHCGRDKRLEELWHDDSKD